MVSLPKLQEAVIIESGFIFLPIFFALLFRYILSNIEKDVSIIMNIKGVPLTRGVKCFIEIYLELTEL